MYFFKFKLSLIKKVEMESSEIKASINEINSWSFCNLLSVVYKIQLRIYNFAVYPQPWNYKNGLDVHLASR